METKNDVLLAYARDAYMVEAYAANTINEMAKEMVDPVSLQELIEQRDIINRRRDRMAMVIRRHGGDVPSAAEGVTTLVSMPKTREAMEPEEKALHSTLTLLTLGHMMMASYVGLVSIARAFPSEMSAKILRDNLAESIRTVDRAYSDLPRDIRNAVCGMETRKAA